MSQTADEPLIAFVRALARRQARIDIELEAQRHSDPDSLQPEARDMPNFGKIRIGDGPTTLSFFSTRVRHRSTWTFSRSSTRKTE